MRVDGPADSLINTCLNMCLMLLKHVFDNEHEAKHVFDNKHEAIIDEPLIYY